MEVLTNTRLLESMKKGRVGGSWAGLAGDETASKVPDSL